MIRAPHPYGERIPAGMSEGQHTDHGLWFLEHRVPSAVTARVVRGKMLEHGVWAISDRQDTIRRYPALNMQESVLREGLQIMDNAIRHAEAHGRIESA